MARGDQQTRQTKTEECRPCLTIECEKQSQLDVQENHRGEGQAGENLSHNGLWNCKTGHA